MSATITNRRRHRYGIVEERTLEDPRLGCVARTVAAWIQVKQDGWKISVEHMQFRLGLGVSAWRRASHELQAAGYLVISRQRGERGRWEWDFDFDLPDEIPDPDRKSTTRKKAIDGQPADGGKKRSKSRSVVSERASAIGQKSIDGTPVDDRLIDGKHADITPPQSLKETVNNTTCARESGEVVVEARATAYRDLLELAFVDLAPEQQQLLADTLEYRLRRPIDPPGSIVRWIGTVKNSLLGQGEIPFDGSGAYEIAAMRRRIGNVGDAVEASSAAAEAAAATQRAAAGLPSRQSSAEALAAIEQIVPARIARSQGGGGANQSGCGGVREL